MKIPTNPWGSHGSWSLLIPEQAYSSFIHSTVFCGMINYEHTNTQTIPRYHYKYDLWLLAILEFNKQTKTCAAYCLHNTAYCLHNSPLSHSYITRNTQVKEVNRRKRWKVGTIILNLQTTLKKLSYHCSMIQLDWMWVIRQYISKKLEK